MELPKNAPISGRATFLFTVIRGAIFTILSAFPVAGTLGLVFRFPVPFSGAESGIEHVVPSLFAVLFYGILGGGFILLAVLGAIGGAFAYKAGHGGKKLVNRLTLLFSLGIAAVTLFIFSIWDWIYGPW